MRFHRFYYQGRQGRTNIRLRPRPAWPVRPWPARPVRPPALGNGTASFQSNKRIAVAPLQATLTSRINVPNLDVSVFVKCHYCSLLAIQEFDPTQNHFISILRSYRNDAAILRNTVPPREYHDRLWQDIEEEHQ